MTAATTARPAAGTQIPILITAEHIANSTPGESCRCAIALAILDAMPDAEAVSVTYEEPPVCAAARVWIGPSAWVRLILGQDGAELMLAVDHDGVAEPCTLTAVVA